jgi:hypothetical protein
VQPALKDIGRMSTLPGVSLLASSFLWDKPVNEIHPLQIHAFIKRMSMLGKRDAAETAVALCIAEVTIAMGQDQILRPAMVDYSPPFHQLMTAGELRDGLLYLGREKGAAVLFALETGLTLVDTGRLTWMQAMKMFQAQTLSNLAQACTRVCPRYVAFRYVFWIKDMELDLPAPMFSLDGDIFDAFGLLWLELQDCYKGLIWVDGTADAEAFKSLVSRIDLGPRR